MPDNAGSPPILRTFSGWLRPGRAMYLLDTVAAVHRFSGVPFRYSFPGAGLSMIFLLALNAAEVAPPVQKKEFPVGIFLAFSAFGVKKTVE